MTARCSVCGSEGLTDRLKGLCPKCLFGEIDSADKPDPILAAGTFGPLEILSKIGQGGMGVVYKARQSQRRSSTATSSPRTSSSTRPAA